MTLRSRHPRGPAACATSSFQEGARACCPSRPAPARCTVPRCRCLCTVSPTCGHCIGRRQTETEMADASGCPRATATAAHPRALARLAPARFAADARRHGPRSDPGRATASAAPRAVWLSAMQRRRQCDRSVQSCARQCQRTARAARARRGCAWRGRGAPGSSQRRRAGATRTASSTPPSPARVGRRTGRAASSAVRARACRARFSSGSRAPVRVALSSSRARRARLHTL